MNYKITLDGNKTFVVSENHPLFVNGEYKFITAINVGDMLVSPYTNEERFITCIEEYED
jgi:hypothetical protein